MSKRPDRLLTEDILESISKIKRYTEGLDKSSFSEDEMIVDAVVRNFEIIGEAANRISEQVKTENPDVEWRRIIGLRNRIVHEYFGIDINILWTIIENNLDDLKQQIEYLDFDES